MSSDVAASTDIAVSKKRVRECLDSARHWTDELPKFADKNQRWADFWDILTGIVGAATGLAVWPVLANNSSDTTAAKILVSAGAIATAICQLIPRVRNYAEVAAKSRELGSQYGALVGRLVDLLEAEVPSGQGRDVVSDFQVVKAKKDGLRRLPERPSVPATSAAMTAKTAAAQAVKDQSATKAAAAQAAKDELAAKDAAAQAVKDQSATKAAAAQAAKDELAAKEAAARAAKV